MAAKKLTLVNLKEKLFIFGALVFFYQRLHSNVGDQRGAEDPCSNAPHSSSDDSQQCAERKLFQSWKQAAEDFDSSPDAMWEANEDSHGAGILRKSSAHQIHNSSSDAVPHHVVKEWLTEVAVLLHESATKPGSDTQGKLDRLFNQTLEVNKTHGADTKWAQNLQTLQDRMQAHASELPNQHPQQFQADNAHFMDLFNRTAAAIHRGSSSHWVQDLQKTKDLLEARMKSLKQKHSHSHTLRGMDHPVPHKNGTISMMVDLHAHMQAVYDNLPSVQQANDPSMTPWARHLLQDQKKLESEFGALRGSHQKHKRAASAEEKPLMERIVEFGKQMCQHESRRFRPECAEFMHAANSSHEESAADKALLSHREWDDKLASEIQSLTRELCEDPARRHHASCSRFHSSAVKADPSTAPKSGLRGGHLAEQILDWNTVKSWKTQKTGLRGGRSSTRVKAPPQVLTRAQLRHTKWQGKIPKVACVTAIPSGRDARARMRYFIDNFNLQSYEGDRQLIIVYHHEDVDARRLIRTVADGHRIRGVATRTHEKMPSTLALRFGAWSSDADVIARWDFNDYHHPQRLSMQIRALALSSRPASLLASSDVKVVDAAHEHGFLVGETRWMHEHWYPLLEEEQTVMKGAESFHLVAVDMPELNMLNK